MSHIHGLNVFSLSFYNVSFYNVLAVLFFVLASGIGLGPDTCGLGLGLGLGVYDLGLGLALVLGNVVLITSLYCLFIHNRNHTTIASTY